MFDSTRTTLCLCLLLVLNKRHTLLLHLFCWTKNISIYSRVCLLDGALLSNTSNRLLMFFLMNVMKISLNFTWKYLRWIRFLLKLQVKRSTNGSDFLKIYSWCSYRIIFIYKMRMLYLLSSNNLLFSWSLYLNKIAL